MNARGCAFTVAMACAAALVAGVARAAGESAREHVPPDPPQSHVHSMPYAEMAEMMGMDDRARYGKVTLDRVEWNFAADAVSWDIAAWYGSDFNKLWIETEGEHAASETDARIEAAWDRIVSAWWSLRAGARHDTGDGPSRTWLGAGFAGTAPGFIEVEAMLYAAAGGRTAARLTTEYDLLITQRLVLQPELELELHGRDDPDRGIGAGLSDVELGLRLRYEIRREIAPYVGVVWSRRFGETADLTRAAGGDLDEISLVAGFRLWF